MRIAHIIFKGLLFIMPAIAVGQDVDLTFSVDMRNEVISPKGVHVAGDFQAAAGFGSNWNPGGTELTDSDGDDIYEITVQVPPGFYLYKFVNGNSWQDKPENPPVECAQNDGGGNFNRSVSVESSGTSLSTIVFDSCITLVHFSVNMLGVPISENGVHVMGDFQEAIGSVDNWNAGATELTDNNQDGTFEMSVSIPPGEYLYTFVNGDQRQLAESFSGECTVDSDSSFAVRKLIVTEGENRLPTVCYNTCNECDPAISTSYETRWWNESVFYEIFVRSFYDSDGDGIGDFRGITEKLDYLNDGDPETTDDLGITGIWLMPMMPSPTYHGYDVSDYFNTEPDYGTLEDFEEFIEEAHQRGIKVIIDFVMNHSSSQNPWFIKSAAGDPEYRDWYVWRDTDPGFNGPWGQQVWYPKNGSYYYGLFWSEMPDLNYDNPEMQEEIFRSAEFWLDRGVDGFRLDAIKYLDENGNVLENTGKTFEILEEFNTLYKNKNTDAVTVGEVWQNTASIIPYIQNDRLDLCFEFDLAFSILDAVNQNNPGNISDQLKVVQSNYPKLQYATFLTNHDIDRVFSTLGGSNAKMKQAAALYLTMPGVPFIYYGEEIGMRGTGAHENIRRPMQWSGGQFGGFSSSAPWYGVGGNYQTNNVALMDTTEGSLLDHYRRLVQIRTKYQPLTKGYLIQAQASDDEVLAYARIFDDQAVVVISNFGSIPKEVAIDIPVTSLDGQRDLVAIDALDVGNHINDVRTNEYGGLTNWRALDRPLNPRETIVIFLNAATTGTEEVEPDSEAQFAVYPNPASDFITVEYKENQSVSGDVTVISANGSLIMNSPVTDIKTTLDISAMAPGMYFVRVQTELGSSIAPLVIAR